MSGFIGMISPQLGKSDTALLDVSAAVITSCCSDVVGSWSSHQADLRFGGLKTSDDITEEQLPYCMEEHLWIVGDVRLDKREALAAALSANFPAVSIDTPDSYLLLYAYKHWGEDCLQHISGDYAFAIWNEQTKYLFCARDHFGLIPFYYTQTDNGFLFTNFYRALKDIPDLMSEIDDDILRNYLLTRTNGSFDQTIYKKVKKLPPAHKLIYKDGAVHISRYWETPTVVKPIRYKTTKEYVSHFYRLFEQSVKDRTRTSRVSCTLSGGMDSSSITAITKKVLAEHYGDNHTLTSYNISYRYLISENEGYFGNVIANHLNIPCREYIAEDCIGNIAKPMTSWIPEPASIPAAAAESQIFADAAGFSKVLLTGFGGDPMFEYDPVLRRRLKEQGSIVQPLLDDLTYHRAFGQFFRKVRQNLRKLVRRVPHANIVAPAWFNPSFFPKEYSPIKPNKDGTSIRSTIAMSTSPYWSGLFETTHPGFAGNQVKVRQPFFSLDLFLFILALPPHLLYQKSLLRMAMTPYLPEEIVTRPKTALFGNPHSQNFKTKEIREMLDKRLLEPDDFLTGKIDMQRLKEAIRDPEQSSGVYDKMLPVLSVLSWRKCLP